MEINQYLQPAATIAIELLRLWLTKNDGRMPERAQLSALYEEALLSVIEGERRALKEIAIDSAKP